jgi:hypothetical protein
MADGSEQSISWNVVTHEHRERTSDWYWALGVLAVIGIGLSIYFSNVLLALIILIGASCIGVLVSRGPREHLVVVDKRGVHVDGTLYAYRSLHSFWVEEDVAEPRLFLTTAGWVVPHLTLPLTDRALAHEVHKYLKDKLDEVEQHAHFGEMLAEICGL